MGRILDRYLNQKVLRRWQRAGQQAAQASLPALRRQRDDARRLKTHLDKLINEAEGRLVRPLIGADQFPRPVTSDWSWRPDLWRQPLSCPGFASASRKARLDPQVTLFHDCDLGEISTRQIRNRRDKDLAPFSLALEVFHFEGTFLSFSVEFPGDAAIDLTGQHLMRVDTLVESEQPVTAFARLNIQNGPNTERVLRKLEFAGPSAQVDFDLAHLDLNERRVEKLWLDFIVENPAMNRVIIRDLTLCRHHRADL